MKHVRPPLLTLHPVASAVRRRHNPPRPMSRSFRSPLLPDPPTERQTHCSEPNRVQQRGGRRQIAERRHAPRRCHAPPQRRVALKDTQRCPRRPRVVFVGLMRRTPAVCAVYASASARPVRSTAHATPTHPVPSLHVSRARATASPANVRHEMSYPRQREQRQRDTVCACV